MKPLNVPFFSESNNLNCAPAAARSVLAYYGINKTEEELVEVMETEKNKGTPPPFFIKGIEKLGLKAKFIHKQGKEEEFEMLKTYLKNNIPVIVSLNMNIYRNNIRKVDGVASWQGKDFTFHYVVVTFVDKEFVTILDNAEKTEQLGKMKLDINTFLSAWYNQYLFGDMFVIEKPPANLK